MKRSSPMEGVERKGREWILRRRSGASHEPLYDLMQSILQNDPQNRAMPQWLVAQGTGPQAMQKIAYFDGPGSHAKRLIQLEQTAAECIFLRELLELIVEGYDVGELLRIEPRKIGHRPVDPLGPQIAYEVKTRMAEGDRYTDAVTAVARLTKKSEAAIRAAYTRNKTSD